jgi:ribosomal protein S18 acetylase RimI-like enzyme
MTLRFEIESLLAQVERDFDPPLSETVDLAAYAEKLALKATNFALYSEGQLAGLVAVYCNDLVNKVAYLTLAAVRKEHRGAGVGSGLLQDAIGYLRRRGFEKFRLETYKTNAGIVDYYGRFGFVIARETDRSVFLELDLAGRGA